jgi:hypothetical protein
MRIKIDPLDVLFSRLIRHQAKGRCQMCGKPKDFKELQTAHCWGRRKKSVRWDLDNALALCFFCHHYIDSEDPEAKRNLFIRHIGKTDYEKLGQRANWSSMVKIDKKLVEIYLKKELAKFNE